MKLPELGEKVMLYPAPLPHSKVIRRVQDGAGNFGRFLPAGGAERAFDYFWHDRLLRGDVLLSDPSKSFQHAKHGELEMKQDKPIAAQPAKTEG